MARGTRLSVVAWPVALLLAMTTTGCTSGRVATPALPEPTASATTVVAPTPSQTLTPRPVPPKRVRPRPVPAALVSYRDCRRLVRTLRREALAQVGPYGLVHSGGGMPAMAGGTATSGSGAASGPVAAPAPASTASSPAFSTTNNQEVGVDEPDLVKTDGTLMVIARQHPSALLVLDVTGARPVLRGRLKLTGMHQVLLIGRTAVLLGVTYPKGRPVTRATVVSLANPSRPRVVRSYYVEGDLRGARLLGGRVVVATQSPPLLEMTYPKDGTPAATAAALLANKRAIRTATTREWLPAITVTPGGQTHRPSCARTYRPGIAAGLGTTTVVTIDPKAASPTQHLTVLGSSAVVYASTSALYLATTSWQNQRALAAGRRPVGSSARAGFATDLHGFDVSVPDNLRYLGTGSVEGTLTNEYALSEHEGHLRVATTVGIWSQRLTDSRVTVLKPINGVLVQVGQVKGLGKGEQIYGVRFLGATGYVVTFRQVDPLYVIDLSNPRRPVTRGELKVTGYSSTLFPLGSGLLLGIGQGVDAQLRQRGAQVSVFDVRRPSRPRLQDRTLLANGYSLAETDHHSLLWWPPARMLVVPANIYSQSRPFNGAIVYRVDRRGNLREIRRLQPPGPAGSMSVTRSVVVGGLLYSVADSGILTSRMKGLDHQKWLPFT